MYREGGLPRLDALPHPGELHHHREVLVELDGPAPILIDLISLTLLLLLLLNF